MLTLYSSSNLSSGVVPLYQIAAEVSREFQLPPAICCIAMLKCACRSNHRVILAPFSLLQRFYIKGSNA